MSGWLARLASSVLGNPADSFSFRTRSLIAVFSSQVSSSQDVRVYAVEEGRVEAGTVVIARAGADLLYRTEGPAPATLLQAYVTDTTEHWNDGLGADVVRLAFVARLPQVTPAEFRRRYEAHAEVAREHHPAITRYVQHFVRHGTRPDTAAIAELHFESADTMRERFYRDESSRGVVEADIAGYLDRERTWSMLIRPAG